MKPRVLIYRSELLAYSETFIAAQAGALQGWQPIFAGARRLARGLELPASSLVAAERGGLAGRLQRQLFRRFGYAPRLVAALEAARPELLHAHFATDAAEALPLLRALGIPLVVTLHGYDVMVDDATHRANARGRVYLARRPELFERANLFLCVSEAVRQKAIARGYPPAKLRVHPVGIDTRLHSPSSHPCKDPLVLFVGRLVEKKGCIHLLRAMQQVQRTLPGARLVVLGDGPLRAQLEAEAMQLTVGTLFLGAQGSADVRAWMRRSRMLAVPSITAADGDAEGLPTVLYEALASGLPVACSHSSGIPELVRHEVEGLLAEEKDEAGLAANLLRLCQDDALAARMGQAGRAQVEESFSLEAQTATLEELYADVLASAKSAAVAASVPASGRASGLDPVLAPVPAPRLRHQAAWMLSGNSIAVLFQAAYFILIGRMLGSREYGAVVGVAALINVLSQFSSLGMEMVLLRNISRDRASFAATWGRALVLSGAGFLVLLAGSLGYARLFLAPELRSLVPWIAVADGLLGKLAQLASRALQGADHVAWSARLIALTNGARTLVAAGLFAWCLHTHQHASAQAWVRVYWLASLAVAVLGVVLVTRTLGLPRFQRLRWCEVGEGLSFSLSSSAISVYNDIDKTLLVSMGQSYAAGIYAAAYRVVDVMTTPIYSLYAAASPRFFREGRQGIAHAERLARHMLRWTVPFGLAAVLALALGSPLLPLAFGHSFAGSAPILRWLCLLPLIRGAQYAWGTTITAASSQWLRTGTQAAAAGLNLILNLLLIPRWSWQGAAVASLATDGALALSNGLLVAWLLRSSRARAREPALAPKRQPA